MNEPSQRRPALWAGVLAAGLLVVLVLWFGRACWGGWWIVEASPIGDMYMLATIWERSALQVTAGHLPLWFPEFAGGYPVHAAWMYGLFYPPTLLFGVLPPESASTWLAILHLVFGAVGMFWFLWEECRDETGAAAGAIVFACSGFMLGRVVGGHLNIVMPVAWAPWVLWAAVRTVRGEPRAAGWLGVCAGFGLLAGHVQIWFYAAPLVAAYAAFSAARGGMWRAAAPRIALAAAIALGIAAIQWIPAWELFSVSGHPQEQRELVERCSAPATALVAQLAPRFFVPDDPRFAHEHVGLAGPLAVVALLLALRLRDPARWFWFAVAVAGVILAMGLRNPVSEFANAIPPFRWARAPGRALVLVVIAGSALAGHLVAQWFGHRRAIPRAMVPAAFLVSALACGIPSPGVVRSDFHDFDFTQPMPADVREHRVFVLRDRYPYLERFGVRTLRDICPLDTPGYKMLLEAPSSVVARWFDVAADIDMTWTGPPADAAATQALLEHSKFRQFVPGGAVQFFARAEAASDDVAYARLRAGENVLLLAPEDGAVDTAVPEAAVASPRIRVRHDTAPGEIAFEIATPTAGWALLSSKWYPGWTCEGLEPYVGEVRRANLAVMAVPVTTGTSSIVLRYAPSWLALAFVLGSASLLAAALVIIVQGRRAR